MKDTLGQDIVVGSVLVYATRGGSTMTMNVAIVKEVVTKFANVDCDFVRCRVIADGGSDFQNGKFVYVRGGKSYREPYTGRNVTLSVGSNAVLVGRVNAEDATILPSHIYDMTLIECLSPVSLYTNM